MATFLLKIKKLKEGVKLPNYAHPGDAGMDVYSLEDKVLKPGECHFFELGFAMEFPAGYVGIVKDRGSMAAAGLHTVGGVYDAGYRGEYGIRMANIGAKKYKVEKGDKIAQIIIYPIVTPKFKEVKELSKSERGEGRHGSTGRK